MRLDFPSTDFNIISTRHKVSSIHTLSFYDLAFRQFCCWEITTYYESSIKPITKWVAWLHQGIEISEIQPLTGQDRTTCDARIVPSRPSRNLFKLRFGNTDNSSYHAVRDTSATIWADRQIAQAVMVDALSCELYPHCHSLTLSSPNTLGCLTRVGQDWNSGSLKH